MTKKLKAYEVHDNYEGHGVVVFETNNAAARRNGASELGTEWESIDRCRRAPGYDEYAPGPVPPLVLIEDGWWFNCVHCSKTVSEHNTDRVAIGEHVFCDWACVMRDWREDRDLEHAKTDLLEVFYSMYPDVQVCHAYADSSPLAAPSEYRHSSVTFRFPGGEGVAEWRFGEDTVLVNRSDIPAWNAWRDSVVGPEQ